MSCLIFDFDGTLTNTLPAIMITLRDTLLRMKWPPPPEGFLMPLIGLPLKEIFARASGSDDDALLAECVRLYRRDFNGNCEGRISLFPGVKDTLDALVGRGDFLAIASSRGRESLFHLIRQLGLESYFQVIAGEEDVMRPKPAADVVLYALQKLDHSRNGALMVGDTVYDIGAGKAAGIKTCAATYSNQSCAELLAAQPDYVINSFPEILSIPV